MLTCPNDIYLKNKGEVLWNKERLWDKSDGKRLSSSPLFSPHFELFTINKPKLSKTQEYLYSQILSAIWKRTQAKLQTDVHQIAEKDALVISSTFEKYELQDG